MDDLLPYLVLAAALAAVMALCRWFAALVRRRGTAGAAVTAALAAYNEAHRVTAYEAHQEMLAQAERQAPAVSPDGRWTPGQPVAAPDRRTAATRRPGRRGGFLARLLGR
ncbi:hypothetical protein ACFV3R_13730 [Streptomyces sp. NPDC059740]|uniref:hypothetical protein n=1 Tax=Streptomyces sp. NPDC059740 TaxID=3346926 RepID=UPI0036494A14